VFEAVRDILGSASRHRPLLLAVEDLQWIDKTSQEFLDYLIGWLAPPASSDPRLPPEFTHPWGNKTYYTEVYVDQLPPLRSAS